MAKKLGDFYKKGYNSSSLGVTRAISSHVLIYEHNIKILIILWPKKG